MIPRISTFIRQVPDFGVRTFNQARTKSTDAFNWISGRISGICTNHVRPLLSHRLNVLYVQPFRVSDAMIIGSCMAIALSIMIIGIPILGKAFIAASVALGLACMIIGWNISRNQIKTQFKVEAAAIIAQMVAIVEGSTQNDPRYVQIADQRILLDNVKFEHLKKKIKDLDKHTDKYENHTQNLNAEIGFDTIKNRYLTHLRGLQTNLPH
jgi:hypothetical protein